MNETDIISIFLFRQVLVAMLSNRDVGGQSLCNHNLHHIGFLGSSAEQVDIKGMLLQSRKVNIPGYPSYRTRLGNIIRGK
jgi:hypothetical protein